MDFKILENKRVVNGSIDFLDLTFDVQGGYKLLAVFVVTPSYVMRWDKICLKFYGDANLADALYKFNGYDNPFSLMEGDEIELPTKESLQSMYKKDDTLNTDQVVDDITPIVVKSKDNARTNFLIRKELRNIPTINNNPTKKENNDGIYTLIKT